MKKFTITYRRLYWSECYLWDVEAYNFADAEKRFYELQEGDNSIIVNIQLK